MSDIPIEQYLQKMNSELQSTSLYQKESETLFILSFEDDVIELTKTPLGCFFSRIIGNLPDEESESLLIYLLFANFLGQGTASSALCLNDDLKTLSLVLPITYEIDYKNFRYLLEEFLNYSDFWKSEIVKKKNL